MSLFERSWAGKLLAKMKDSISSKNHLHLRPVTAEHRGLANRHELASGTLTFTLTHEQGIGNSISFTIGCFLLDDGGKLNDAHHDFASHSKTRARGGVCQWAEKEGSSKCHIRVETEIVPERYSKMLLVMSMRDGEPHLLRKLNKLTLTVNKMDKHTRQQNTLLEVSFNLKMLGGETTIVLGCFDRKALSFDAAGIACHEGFDQLGEYLLERNELMSALNSRHPNHLDVDFSAPVTADELIQHLIWGTTLLIEQLLSTKYTQEFAQERGIELLARCRASWNQSPLFGTHEILVSRLIEDGVDWHASLNNGEANDLLSINDKITHLLKHASSCTPWERAVLRALSDEVIITYLKGVTQKDAEAVYALAPRECMLNFVGEKIKGIHLERDLGL